MVKESNNQTFNINHHGTAAFKCYELLMILSWDKAYPIMQALNFPTLNHPDMLHTAARGTVKKFKELGKNNFYDGREPSAEVHLLLAEFYDQLSDDFGQEIADLIVEWGNRFNMERDFHYSIYILYSIFLYRIFYKNGEVLAEWTAFFGENYTHVEALVFKHVSFVENVTQKLSELSRHRTANWNLELYHLYREEFFTDIPPSGGLDEYDYTPAQILREPIRITALRAFLKELGMLLNSDEMQRMDEKIATLSDRQNKNSQAARYNLCTLSAIQEALF